MTTLVLAFLVLFHPLVGVQHEVGRFSSYAPGDGFNAGELACGGQFTKDQVHIAYRRWHRRGCGSSVLVYSSQTNRMVLTTIQDAGPFGIYTGPLRHAKRDGRWRVFTGSKPPKGWKWRGLIDASYGLWVALDRPGFLSRVHIYHLPDWVSRSAKRSLDFLSI